jgi:hypothetical protein
MKKRPSIAITALVLGVVVSSAPAFAQNGPGAMNFSASSNPQTGGQPYAAQTAPKGRSVYDVAPQQQPSDSSAINGPGAMNFSASSNPQTGGKGYSAQASGQSQAAAPPASSQTLGPAGPAGANFSAASNPQTGR